MGQAVKVGLLRPFVENAEMVALLRLMKAQRKRKRVCMCEE